MIALPLVSCNTSADTNTDTGTTAADGDGNEVLDIPDENFDMDFVLLTPENVTYCYAQMDFDEPSEDAYELAYYTRNLGVEELLGINITSVESGIGGGVYDHIKTDVESGTYSYHAVFNNMTMSCTATGAGLCYALDEFEYVDLSKSWWNDDATEQLSIGNLHYMVAGDISISDKEGIWVIYFTKDFISQYGLENPYELVMNNEWTLDKMHEMAKEVANDENGDGVMDSSDMWGLCTHGENWAATWQSAGLKLVRVDEDGIPEVAWGTEEFNNVYEKTAQVMGDAESVSAVDIGFISSALKNKQTLFANEIVAFIRDYRTIEHEFGIVPYPKYNADIDEYSSFIVTNSCVMTVPKSCDDTYTTGIILEALAKYGQDIITPAYYEGQLKSRYSRDEESAAMLDIIFENRAYDLGVFFDWGDAYTILKDPTITPAAVFPALKRSCEKSIQKSLSKLDLY